jgi:hypothetical protein
VAKERHQIVTVERDWKEYLGECLLIVFSVALAIGLTEYLTSLHERKKAGEILHQLKEELIANKSDAQEQYAYYQQVFNLIDSAKHDTAFSKQFLENGKIHFNLIMPHGALLHDLKETAWQQAKENDVFSTLNYDTYSLLTNIYSSQERFLNLEPTLEKIFFSYESRKQENLDVTLTLLHDALYAWVAQRTPELIENYQKGIDALSKY